MGSRILTTSVLAVLVLGACASPPDRDWIGDDLAGEAMTVLEFDMRDAVVKYGGPHDGFGLALAEEVASQLRRRGFDAQAAPAGDVPETPVVISGRILHVNSGNRATRYLVGFGAGAARFGAAGSLLRADGTELASFSRERASSFGIFGGSSSSLVQKCLRSVGNDIAEFVKTGRYEN
jgi:hypothetical protein